MLTLILASQSPRRRELLLKAGYQFHTYTMEISEIIDENLSLDEALMQLAKQKTDALLASRKLPKFNRFLVLSADTVVVLNSEVIGKPVSLLDAHQTLRRLSGRGHLVKTAVCMVEYTALQDNGNQCTYQLKAEDSSVCTSEVYMKNLTDQEIEDYIKTCRPLDKAGAYGVQDMPKGYIEKIVGDTDNVMGLPMRLVEAMFERNRWTVASR